MDIAEAQEAVAKEYGFSLYRSYGERVTAQLIGVDDSTLKRWRELGKSILLEEAEACDTWAFI